MQEDKAQRYRFTFEEEDKWRQHLSSQGFVVIANWLTSQQAKHYVQQFWGVMEKLSDGCLDRNDVSTQILGKNYPPVLHGGMIQYIAHSKPQWELRKLCKPLFAKLWRTEQVKSSFDGFCFMNGVRNYSERLQGAFLHCDQSPLHKGVWSYQGIMTLTDNGENGGGFVCVPKSNNYHEKYFIQIGKQNHKDNWFLVPEADKVKEPLCNTIKVNSKAGDFILFDSRTFHCNTVPTQKLLRVCSYICMLPQKYISKKTAQLKQKACQNRRNSNHHPGNGFKTFPKMPRYPTNTTRERLEELIAQVNSYELDKECKQLI